MQHLKKAFTAFTVFATILWSLGLPFFPTVSLMEKAREGNLPGVALADKASLPLTFPAPEWVGRDLI